MRTDYQTLYDEADAAGKAAVAAMTPIPMIVGTPKSLFSNELDYSKPIEYVADGVCGFAWVDFFIRKNSPLAKWLKSRGYAKDRMEGKGVYIWIRDYNQSMQKKEAYAYAFAKVFNDAGYDKVYSNSRLD